MRAEIIISSTSLLFWFAPAGLEADQERLLDVFNYIAGRPAL
jgi:hypothetical protein